MLHQERKNGGKRRNAVDHSHGEAEHTLACRFIMGNLLLIIGDRIVVPLCEDISLVLP